MGVLTEEQRRKAEEAHAKAHADAQKALEQAKA